VVAHPQRRDPAHPAVAFGRGVSRDLDEKGSPLLLYCRELAAGIESSLQSVGAGNIHVALGMSYGNPSIGSALDELHAKGVRRLLVLPLYPQYSGTTTGSVFDAVTSELSERRWVPEFRFINHYHDRPDYIRALAASIREYWDANGRGDKLMFSFHGTPKQTLLDGDPYHCHCLKTARLVTNELGLDKDDWVLSFQSRVGRAEWLKPYTDETIEELGRAGTGRLDVVCPGFSVDCLETLEEIAMQNAELYTESGGGDLTYIPCLNARQDHVSLLADLVAEHARGWPEFYRYARRGCAARGTRSDPTAGRRGRRGAMNSHFLEFSVRTPDILESLGFYKLLGFSELETSDAYDHRYAVVSDGDLCIGLHDREMPAQQVTLVQPDLAKHARSMVDHGYDFKRLTLEEDLFNELELVDSDGNAVAMVEARTFFPSADAEDFTPCAVTGSRRRCRFATRCALRDSGHRLRRTCWRSARNRRRICASMPVAPRSVSRKALRSTVRRCASSARMPRR
jgi:ferrochelatase